MGRAEKLTEEGTQAVLDEDYDKANALFEEAAELGDAGASNDFYDYFGDDTYLIQNDLILGL
jgi:hypothetical protein